MVAHYLGVVGVAGSNPVVPIFIKKQLRNVAQFGSAPCSGRGGRRFKSCHSDFFLSSRRFSQFRFFTLSLKICNSDPDSYGSFFAYDSGKSCHSDFFLSSRRFSQFRFFTLSLKICNSDPDSYGSFFAYDSGKSCHSDFLLFSRRFSQFRFFTLPQFNTS